MLAVEALFLQGYGGTSFSALRQPVQMLADHAIFIEHEVAEEVVSFEGLPKPEPIVRPHLIERQGVQAEPQRRGFGGFGWCSGKARGHKYGAKETVS
jgi:hypothetical protein